MTLTTHTITGATLATLTPNNPLLGFTAGFLSHYLLDAIPHWSYSLGSMKEDKNNPLNNDMIINRDFLIDLVRISADAVLGLLIVFVIFGLTQKYSLFIALCGAIGAMAPDALQFFYMKCRHEPLTSLQRFHLWIHAKANLNNKQAIGIISQAFIVFLVLIFSIQQL